MYSLCSDIFLTFLFSAFCTNYVILGVSFNSSIGYRATISSPCISIRYWSLVIDIASSAERGHRNAPLSSLLYIRRNPSPSHSKALMRSDLLPQNKNNVFLSYGSSLHYAVHQQNNHCMLKNHFIYHLTSILEFSIFITGIFGAVLFRSQLGISFCIILL